jgi:hypothetical protein
LAIKTREATGHGAAARSGTFAFNPNAGEAAADALANFIWLELIELAPGKDPQTKQGLRDLMVVSGPKNHLKLAIEAAFNERKIDRNADGTPYTGAKRCCQDLWPGTDTANETGTRCP